MRQVRFIRGFIEAKERLAGPTARRAAYFPLVQAAYSCLAGAFEMPMAFRLVGSIQHVVIVYTFYYCMLFAGFMAGLVLIREGDASKVFRLELGMLAALNFGTAALYPRFSGVPALACYFLVRGLAEGLYWAARHRTMLWALKDSARDRFAFRLQSLVVAVSVVLPLLAGALITHLGAGARRDNPLLPPGYVPVFLFTGTVLALACLASPRLGIGRSKLSFAKAASLFADRKSRAWSIYVAACAAAGSCVSVGAGIMTFGILKTEFRIGAFNAGIALMSSLTFALMGRFLAGRKGVRTRGVLLGAAGDCLSRAIYASAPNAAGLGAKAVLDAFASPVKSLMGENLNFAYIERLCARTETSQAEVYLYRETVIWIARILFCAVSALALAFAGGARAEGARLMVALAAAVPLGEYLFLRSIARELAPGVEGGAAGGAAR